MPIQSSDKPSTEISFTFGLVFDDEFVVVFGCFGSSAGAIVFRKRRRETKVFHLPLQFVGASFDRHPRDVEPEREEAVLAHQPLKEYNCFEAAGPLFSDNLSHLEPRSELVLGKGECVAEVKPSVHVGVGECSHKLVLTRAHSITLVKLLVVPCGLHLTLDGLQGLDLKGPFPLDASHPVGLAVRADGDDAILRNTPRCSISGVQGQELKWSDFILKPCNLILRVNGPKSTLFIIHLYILKTK